MGRFMFTEFVDVTVYSIVLCLTIVYVWMSMSRGRVCRSRAERCDAEYRKGKGWQSGHVRLIPGRVASECPRWPESIGEQERPLTCHMPPLPPRTPPPTVGHFIASAACLHGYGKTRSTGSRPPITRSSTL